MRPSDDFHQVIPHLPRIFHSPLVGCPAACRDTRLDTRLSEKLVYRAAAASITSELP